MREKSATARTAQSEKRGISVFAIIAIVIACVLVFGLLAMALGLFSVLVGVLGSGGYEEYGYGNVAVIPLEGTLLTSGSSSAFGDAIVSSSRIIDLLREANDDPSIEAVILEINSPGGSGVASDEIAQQVRRMDKPVISVIREVGASGAYWVASSTEYIFANRMSIVGSIGVIASSLNFAEFIDDHNVSYERFVAGENKDFGTPFRDVTPEERARFQAQLDEMHAIFIEEVALGRGLSVEHVRRYADGFILTARQAQEAGLIDEIGTMDDAEEYLFSQYNITPSLVYYHAQPTLLSALFGYSSEAFYAMGRGIGESMTTRASERVMVRT